MKSIGYDENLDDHCIPEEDDPTLHKVDPLCGCNPDAWPDENPYDFTPKPEKASKYYWIHHHLGYD